MDTYGWDWGGGDDRPLWERVLVGLRDGAFLGPEPGVRRRGLVSLNAGWLARGGLLRLHHDRLEFEPNPLERVLGARRRTISFRELAWIERRPRPGEVSPVGEAARMRVHLHDGGHLDLLPAGGNLDAWIAEVLESFAWWRGREARRRDAIDAETSLR